MPYQLLLSDLLYHVWTNFTILPCLTYYLVTFIIGYMIIQIIKLLSSKYQYSLLELVTAFIYVACSMENCYIYYHYGMVAYLTTTVVLSHILSFIFPFGHRPNPCDSFTKYLKNEVSWRRFVTNIICQLIGGLFAAHIYTQIWYSLHPTPFHAGRSHHKLCNPLTVSVGNGFFIELIAALNIGVVNLISKQYIAQTESNANKTGLLKKLMIWVIKNFVSLAWLAYGYHKTGVYINPMNASVRTILCTDTYIVSHVLVYWMGPLLSVWILHSSSNDKYLNIRTKTMMKSD